MVVTRFAPSPTGMLHIGAARTAYFNWLFAKHHKGKYLLRLEDTDKRRSGAEATKSILEGLKWLGIEADEPPFYQSKRADRHREVVAQLLAQKKAYKCYASVEELAQMRAEQKAKGLPLGYDGRWRPSDVASDGTSNGASQGASQGVSKNAPQDASKDAPQSAPQDIPKGVAPTIRFAAPREGKTIIKDLIQGEVEVANKELDDMVLMRSDGSPTYMLAVAVDDSDMGITHVIRGDDHLTNSFRQIQLFNALGVKPPQYAHMPLLHGKDGAKLSKRDGASGIEEWQRQGYLPEAILNYLVRLGWSYQNEEIISKDQATKWFSLEAVGRSPARFDAEKLIYLNGYYLRHTKTQTIADHLRSYGELTNTTIPQGGQVGENGQEGQNGKSGKSGKVGQGGKNGAKLLGAIELLKTRVKTLKELAERVAFLGPIPKQSHTPQYPQALRVSWGKNLITALEGFSSWQAEPLESFVRDWLATHNLVLKEVAQTLRQVLTASKVSPPIFAVMELLGKQETLARLKQAL